MLSRWILCSALMGSATLLLAGCENKVNERVEAAKSAAVSLGQTPEEFRIQYNAMLLTTAPVALKETSSVIDQSLINMYQIQQMKHLQGKQQGLIEASVGPQQTHIIGKVNDKGELVSIGGNLNDNSGNAKRDFLLAMSTIGCVISGASAQELNSTLQRLMTTVLANPTEMVAASVNKTLLTASVSTIGITIEVTHVQ